VENLKRVGRPREGSSYPLARQCLGAPCIRSLRDRVWEAQEGRFREAGSTACGERSGEASETHESIGLSQPRLSQVRISAGSKALELRGIVNSWSSEQEHAMPETARGHRRREAYGSVEGKGSEG
jgi:hypothetical protein